MKKENTSIYTNINFWKHFTTTIIVVDKTRTKNMDITCFTKDVYTMYRKYITSVYNVF